MRFPLFNLVESPLLALGSVVVLSGEYSDFQFEYRPTRCSLLPGEPPPPPIRHTPRQSPVVATLRGDDGKDVQIRAGDTVVVHPDHLEAVRRKLNESEVSG